MQTENSVLMQNARESLNGKQGVAVGVSVIYLLIVGSIGIIPIVGSLASLFIAGHFAVGLSTFSLAISRNQDARIEQLFLGFNNYVTILGAYLLMILYILLWTLLLIIPGIIAALSYSMTFYILADDDTIKAQEALDKSKKMMDGYKWKYFCLGLRFIGWALLCLLTLGIGFFWLIPYIHVSVAKFYDDIKDKQSIPDLAQINLRIQYKEL